SFLNVLETLPGGNRLCYSRPEVLSISNICRHVRLLAQRAVAAQKILEVHGLDSFHQRRFAVADLSEWDPMDRNPIGRKKDIRTVHEPDKRIVVGVSDRP